MKTQSSVKIAVAIEVFSTSVADIDICGFLEGAVVDEHFEPLLEITREGAIELSVGQHAVNSDAGIIILAFIQLPAGTKEVVESSDGTVGPTDRELASLVLEPKHKLLGAGRSGIALGVGSHEVIADVALEGSAVGASPVIGGGNRINA